MNWRLPIFYKEAEIVMDVIIVLIYGLVLGSFYNVVALRGLEGESLGGRSRCPGCGTTLRVWNLVPVFSYVAQRGKCSNCDKHISKLYPIMETIVGISFAMAYTYHGLSWEFLVAVLMFTMLSIGAITDYIEGVVMDIHSQPIGLLVCLLVLVTYPRGYLNVVTGVAVSIALLYCVRKQKLGMGDVVIISTVFVANGLLLGDVVMFLSAALSLMFCVVLKHKKIRFIPFWLAGYFLLYILLNVGLLDKLKGVMS
jgi:leader peptidase (prepilin peptidase)/N-methyltransferase